MNDVFDDLKTSIDGFDKYYDFYDDRASWQKGHAQKETILRLFQAAAAIDPARANLIYRQGMGSNPPKTAADVSVKRKENAEKVLVAILDQIRRQFDWINLLNPRNLGPAQFICTAYNTLDSDDQRFVDKEISDHSKNRFKNQRDFCMRVYSQLRPKTGLMGFKS